MTTRISQQDGFSLAELMVSMAIMLLIAGGATTALLKMTGAQATIWNRTQMHSGIRGATEVLQQEVGQAGRVAIPNRIALGGAVVAGTQTIAVNCLPTSTSCVTGTSAVSGLFVGEKVLVDAGCFDTTLICTSREETVTLTGVNTTTNAITAVFTNPHASGAPVQTRGVFATGVIPPLASPSAYAPGTSTFSYANGSTGSVLKLYGDINADGKMVYVEYSCVIPAAVSGVQSPGNLYRNSMDWNAAAPSPAPAPAQILLGGIMPNPDGSPCFTYQTQVVSGIYYVTDVAITLTVQTQLIDPVTKQFQTETKALLNVSPRNVFNAWALAGLSMSNRIQPIPPQVALLLP
jgi:prepilin-type N-terminal cleavage/methylation domain-containing protein